MAKKLKIYLPPADLKPIPKDVLLRIAEAQQKAVKKNG